MALLVGTEQQEDVRHRVRVAVEGLDIPEHLEVVAFLPGDQRVLLAELEEQEVGHLLQIHGVRGKQVAHLDQGREVLSQV